MKRRTPGAVGYCCGALDALVAIYKWDGVGVAYSEVLMVFDTAELIAIAKRTGRMRDSGLSEYTRREKRGMKGEKKMDLENEVNYGTLDEALAKWADGHPVWTIEMGGLGPGYEQCIQVGAFEMAKALRDTPLPDDKEPLNRLLDDTLHGLCKTQPPLAGLSGAQAGAINSLAYHFLKDGYNETLHQVEKERRIQASRTFPAMAA